MTDILHKIAADKRREVEMLKRELPLSQLERKIPVRPRFTFRQVLEDPSSIRIIAELKKGSPSRGVIAADFDPVELADKYLKGGAAALSILTEKNYFYGSYDYVAPAAEATGLPILCKDFVVDPYQLYHARYIGADAVLLIVRLHSKESLVEMITLAETLGLDCLVEVHGENETETAVAAGAHIIGVNNRNLADLTVDLATSERLANLIPDDVIAVSESGIFESADIARLKQAGYTRFLIGEALVKASDPVLLLKTLRSA